MPVLFSAAGKPIFTAAGKPSFGGCGPGCTADFTYAFPDLINTPRLVDFTDTSTGATSWSWDFDDGGATSTVQNPSHTFSADGVYEVVLTVNGGACVTRRFVAINDLAPCDPYDNIGPDSEFSVDISGFSDGQCSTCGGMNGTHILPNAGFGGACCIFRRDANICPRIPTCFDSSGGFVHLEICSDIVRLNYSVTQTDLDEDCPNFTSALASHARYSAPAPAGPTFPSTFVVSKDSETVDANPLCNMAAQPATKTITLL